MSLIDDRQADRDGRIEEAANQYEAAIAAGDCPLPTLGVWTPSNREDDKGDMVNQMNMCSLVAQFADDVAQQTDAIERGDHKTGNKHARRYIATFGKLRAMGDVGRDALCALLAHERSDVRVMAAAYLLRHRTADALRVLREAAKGSSLVAFEASEAMARWEEKTWGLDPA